MIFRCMHIYIRIDLRLFFFERTALSVLCGELVSGVFLCAYLALF